MVLWFPLFGSAIFSKLTSLTISDASKINDFSPVWSLKDTLEYLMINGARSNADLSGVSALSKLRSLDLEYNQLSNLNFIESFPQLIEFIWLETLDLSDPGIQANLYPIFALSFRIIVRVREGIGIIPTRSKWNPKCPNPSKTLVQK